MLVVVRMQLNPANKQKDKECKESITCNNNNYNYNNITKDNRNENGSENSNTIIYFHLKLSGCLRADID